MAAPNLRNITTATGKTAYAVASGTSSTALLSNASGSGTVCKVTYLASSNSDSAACNATLNLYSQAAGAGTAYPILSTVSIPAYSTIVVIGDGGCLYLEEDKSLYFTAGTSAKLNAFASYELLA